RRRGAGVHPSPLSVAVPVPAVGPAHARGGSSVPWRLPCPGCFAGLSANLLLGVFHPLPLVRFGGAQTADCRGDFAEQLFVNSFEGDYRLPLDLGLYTGRQLIDDRVGEAQT